MNTAHSLPHKCHNDHSRIVCWRGKKEIKRNISFNKAPFALKIAPQSSNKAHLDDRLNTSVIHMDAKMNGKHLFIPAILLLVLMAMSLTVKGTPEQVTVASDTEIRNSAEIPHSTPELYKRVCGMHSWKCGARRRSSVIKVKKNHINSSFTSLPNYSDPYRAILSIS